MFAPTTDYWESLAPHVCLGKDIAYGLIHSHVGGGIVTKMANCAVCNGNISQWKAILGGVTLFLGRQGKNVMLKEKIEHNYK